MSPFNKNNYNNDSHRNPDIDHQEIQEETVPKKKKRKNKGKDDPFTQVNDFSQINEPNHSE